MKRLVDIALSALGLTVTAPVLVITAMAIKLEDGHSPLYVSTRAARGGGGFRMLKYRTMVPAADRIGGSSTAGSDPRITKVGSLVRRYKLDEIIQLWNVLRGDMSLVGPRPQVVEDTKRYSNDERRMLSIRPGITDLASIVFADEGDILAGLPDPDLAYNQIIRPWKSRLALAYVAHGTVRTDLRILGLTVMAMFARSAALRGVQRVLHNWAEDPVLVAVAGRSSPLYPAPPPGASRVVSAADLASPPVAHA